MMTTGKVYGLTPPSLISAPEAVEPPVPVPVQEPIPETVVAQTTVHLSLSGDEKIGVNTETPSQNLDVSGNVKLPDAPISEVVEKPVNKPGKQKLVES